MVTPDWILFIIMAMAIIVSVGIISYFCHLTDKDKNKKDLVGHIRTIEGNEITIGRLLQMIETLNERIRELTEDKKYD